jgi:hypothetical protein
MFVQPVSWSCRPKQPPLHREGAEHHGILNGQRGILIDSEYGGQQGEEGFSGDASRVKSERCAIPRAVKRAKSGAGRTMEASARKCPCRKRRI